MLNSIISYYIIFGSADAEAQKQLDALQSKDSYYQDAGGLGGSNYYHHHRYHHHRHHHHHQKLIWVRASEGF